MVMIDFSQVQESHLDDDFGEFVIKHWRLLCKIAYEVVHDYGEAEDIASEAVAKVCRVLGRESIGAIGAYLNKAVYQVAIDRLEKRDNEISLELLVERGLDTEFGSPASVVVLWEEMNEVDVAMRRLSPRMAQSLRLRYLNDLDFEQIALEQKCPVGTVKSDVRRGIKRLRKEILNSRNSYSAA